MSPHVTALGGDDFLSVWWQSSPEDTSIWASHYDGGSWSPSLRIGNEVGPALVPAVCSDGRGNAVAVWNLDDGLVSYSLWANHYQSGKGWDEPVLLETASGCVAVDPGLAMNSAGNVVVVWTQDDGGRPDIWANVWR